MLTWKVWQWLVVGLLLEGAVVWVGLSLNSDSAVSKFSAVASAAAAVGGLLAFVVLVIYTVETHHLRITTEGLLRSQHRVQEDQVKLSLFDKRFFVYSGVHEFFMSILRNNGVDMMSEDYRNFADRIEEAECLFGADVNGYLAEIKKIALDLHPKCAERKYKSEMRQDISALSLDITTAMKNLGGLILDKRNAVFSPYLHFD